MAALTALVVGSMIGSGVYGYARAGFGNYIGFTSAFGYWVSAWVGNVAYLVLLFSTLGYFFGAFEGGATVPAIIGGSILLWILHAMTLRGVKTAAFVNVLVTKIFRCCWRRFHSSSEFAGPEGPCRGDPESVVGKRYSACTVTLLVQAPPSTWAARCPIATARRAKASAVHDAMRTTH